jgi:glyoxylase-like metal-dependent hydrolase (beta-lactamase superfamily II)
MPALADELPHWITWRQRPFPNANLLLLNGATSALVDSGFVTHADRTAEWVARRASTLDLVVNTHWHSDHVGANSLLQQQGAGIAASAVDGGALNRLQPGCCLSAYLDQPVEPYTVDHELSDGDVLPLGEAAWQVIATPGHTPGHLVFWQPDEQVLALGDLLSTYDVGWVNLALDGPDAAATALASLEKVATLRPRILLPAHGAIPADTAKALDAALRRAQRLVEDPDGAVWYGSRRIIAFALMIHDGIRVSDAEAYVVARPWAQDAARLLALAPEDFARDLLDSMTRSGAVAVNAGMMRATAEYTV